MFPPHFERPEEKLRRQASDVKRCGGEVGASRAGLPFACDRFANRSSEPLLRSQRDDDAIPPRTQCTIEMGFGHGKVTGDSDATIIEVGAPDKL
jgi:hypothetical protein